MVAKSLKSHGWIVAITASVTLVVVAILLVITGAILMKQEPVREAVAAYLHSPAAEMGFKPFELRESVIRDRGLAFDSGNMTEVAAINAALSSEAKVRALAVHHAWINRRNSKTRLYGQHTRADANVWNYRNTAADFFCFHLHAAMRLNPVVMPSLIESLDAESALRTPQGLCTPINAETGEPLTVDHDELMFGTSEYCKDGLLSIYERHGNELIGKRLITLLNVLIAESRHPTRYGAIPGGGAEINGNLLQLCGRLSFATGDPAYADFAGRIADAVIHQSMPANYGLPPKFHDYVNDKVIDPAIKLKDHGNEILLGLAEAYALAVSKRDDPVWSDRAGRWTEPLANMYQLILDHGTDADGLLVATLEPGPSGPRITTGRLCDNWGYILSGALLYVDAGRRHGGMPEPRLRAIEARVEALIGNILKRTPSRPWDGSMDAEADAVESALYIANFLPKYRHDLLRWVDHQIALMYSQQTANGLAGGNYLDGNFIRTSLMYADARSGGWQIVPWRADVEVGFAVQPGGPAHLVVTSDAPYTGTLVPDSDRHRTLVRLPWNWPRLNSWPEWYIPSGALNIRSVKGNGTANFSTTDHPSASITLPANGVVQIVIE